MYGDSPPPHAVSPGKDDSLASDPAQDIQGKGMTTVFGCEFQVDRTRGVVRVNGPDGRCLFRLCGIPKDQLSDYRPSKSIDASLGDHFVFSIF